MGTEDKNVKENSEDAVLKRKVFSESSNDDNNSKEKLNRSAKKTRKTRLLDDSESCDSDSMSDIEMKSSKQKQKKAAPKEIKKTPIKEESYDCDSMGTEDENVKENSEDAVLKRKIFSESSNDDNNSKENLNRSAKKTGNIRLLDDSESCDSDSMSDIEMKSAKQKQKKAAPKESKKNSKNSKKTNSKIEHFKKYIRLAGVRITCYNKLWKNCKTDKAKIEKLKQVLVDAGLKGTPTIEKCKKLQAKRERKEEVKSLDVKNIINSENGRPKRNTRSLYANASSKPLEENRSSSQFSRIKYLLDSEESD